MILTLWCQSKLLWSEENAERLEKGFEAKRLPKKLWSETLRNENIAKKVRSVIAIFFLFVYKLFSSKRNKNTTRVFMFEYHYMYVGLYYVYVYTVHCTVYSSLCNVYTYRLWLQDIFYLRPRIVIIYIFFI